MVGHSPPMREVFALGARAAESDLPLLITGETGTGKEICAAAIHGASARRDGPFVVCDLGGLSRTVIENELFGHVRGAFTGADHDRSGSFPAATGGTILIDEIGELERDLQPRLLRAIERREIKPVGSATYQQVDVRVIAATQVDLEAEVAAGRFRRDLYHRLAVLHLELPPLRARKEDIPRLVRRFVDAIRPGGAVEIPPDTLAALGEHDWPGNVRELRNVVERALTVAPRARRLEPSLLEIPPPAGRGEAERADVPFHEAKEKLVSSWERGYLADLLRKTGGSVAEAARRSGVDRAHLYRLLKKHGLIE
jgi:DNA-binding NtrC family response regulator